MSDAVEFQGQVRDCRGHEGTGLEKNKDVVPSSVTGTDPFVAFGKTMLRFLSVSSITQACS